ncbi:uncharacterized protein NPIL_420131 [Nephila pilipes]|uniref:Uncharacterized protein n=1 Tax=Nephila pilipes TaxID=299642 RepID=A0A8X6IST0_NEPPI|nr:uncharacterized protein NPIL_420131 [Nephila pilipes]
MIIEDIQRIKKHIQEGLKMIDALRQQIKESKETLHVYTTTNRRERIMAELLDPEKHFGQCMNRKDYMRLTAENVPIQEKLDQINRKLLEVEERCMMDIVNRSQWVDIFPPGFERSLAKLFPRLKLHGHIRPEHFDALAAQLAESLKRIHSQYYDDWPSLQDGINQYNHQLTTLQQDIEGRKKYLEDIETETTRIKMQFRKLTEDIAERKRECLNLAMGNQFQQFQLEELLKRLEDTKQVTIDLEEELTHYPSPKTPSPVTVLTDLSSAPISPPAVGSGVFTLSPEFDLIGEVRPPSELWYILEMSGLESTPVKQKPPLPASPQFRLQSPGMLGAVRTPSEMRYIDSIEGENSLVREESPGILGLRQSFAGTPESVNISKSVSVQGAEYPNSVMRYSLEVSTSVRISTDSIELEGESTSPESLIAQHQKPPRWMDQLRNILNVKETTAMEDSSDISGSVDTSPDSIHFPENVASPVPVSELYHPTPPSWARESPYKPDLMSSSSDLSASLDLSDIISSAEQINLPVPSLLPYAPAYVGPAKMSKKGAFCNMVLKMNEAAGPERRMRHIELKKIIVRGTPPISESVGRRFDRKHGLFTPKSVITRRYVGVRRPLFGGRPFPPRAPSPNPPPLDITIEWEKPPEEA